MGNLWRRPLADDTPALALFCHQQYRQGLHERQGHLSRPWLLGRGHAEENSQVHSTRLPRPLLVYGADEAWAPRRRPQRRRPSEPCAQLSEFLIRLVTTNFTPHSRTLYCIVRKCC